MYDSSILCIFGFAGDKCVRWRSMRNMKYHGVDDRFCRPFPTGDATSCTNFAHEILLKCRSLRYDEGNPLLHS